MSPPHPIGIVLNMSGSERFRTVALEEFPVSGSTRDVSVSFGEGGHAARAMFELS